MKDAWIIAVAACFATLHAQPAARVFRPEIPKTWDNAAIPTLEIPLANPSASPIHVSSEYYYRIPVRPIYKSYTVFTPVHERPGYIDSLLHQEPVVLWDDTGHAPPLNTEADWIRAGEMVFDAAVVYDGITTAADVQKPDWYTKTGVLLASEGVMPFLPVCYSSGGQTGAG